VKIQPGDLEERKLWTQYMEAYEDVLNRTSTEYAPWYVIPAIKNGIRNLLIANILR
jgi:polyphosphate kinase 2 (PPK2 family)